MFGGSQLARLWKSGAGKVSGYEAHGREWCAEATILWLRDLCLYNSKKCAIVEKIYLLGVREGCGIQGQSGRNKTCPEFVKQV